jgi:hypothetical protein
MRWRLMLAIEIALWLGILIGCASREPANTDDHHRLPQPNCVLWKLEGHMRRICCVDDHCYIAD